MMRSIRMICAGCNSRDAKSCVSQGGICDYCQAYYWMSVLLWEGRETQHFASLLGLRHWVNDEELKAICAACNSRDAKSCVSRGKNVYIASGIIACGYCYGKDGRRKILRLYWACAIEWMMRIKGWYTLATKVETQNLASHKGEMHTLPVAL